MKTTIPTRSNICPRCKSGFIVYEGSMDGDASCLNCGHHVESNIGEELHLAKAWRGELAGPAGEVSLVPDAPHRRARRSSFKLTHPSGLDL